ncbi:rRNA pseudouridine synthase [Paenibacillus albiflavus]|uniref:Pseudouridine synthase n=1 Tax=Paenibacillus albiflavus TaxID=2545760 RepID=A0A4V2WPZ3_9BACL|nr:pseudouridine synthase [Paenibacillus albiflavus]TCZ81252.1 rRNA pseudouridine synthase [Paenibacillus albiflavus]
MERLQKVMAAAGVASRRKCEEIIAAGRVQVNEETVTTLGMKVDPNTDVITVDGRQIGSEKKIYIIFNKPKGVITSANDPEGRRVVTSYLKGITERVYPVGRLDYDTEGLLLLTNDGEFAHLLTHPKHHVPKTYHATVKGVPHGSVLDKLREGVLLEDGITAPAEVEYVDVDLENKQSVISITIHEGRNRQVRRMFEAVSYPVQKLKRVKFGALLLNGLPRGKFRILTPKEVKEITDEAIR